MASVLTVSALWLVWTKRSQRVGPNEAQQRQPFVQVAGSSQQQGDRVLRERAEYFDPTPLFFPTEHNFGANALPDNARRRPGEVFGSYAPKFNFSEQVLGSYGMEVTAAPERLADVLAQGNEAPFAGYGQADAILKPLPPRSGYLEVKNLATGKIIVAQSLEDLKLPKKDFDPMEFFVAVGPAGLVGDPVLTASSGWEETDLFFRDFLAQTASLGERLSPGRYRVFVGP